VATTFVVSTALAMAFVWGTINFPQLRSLEMLFCFAVFAFCAFRGGVGEQGAVQRWIVLIGNASYSIYLTHSFVAGPVKRIWSGVFRGQYPLVMILVIVAGSIALGLASYRWVEQPVLRFKWRGRGIPSPT
jgi:peptidoglycan/LPS O-acetylase OafA/YrhL